MKKFELFMCCLGNGVTVCNKAVTENGDYTKVAHIAEHGHINFYIPVTSIPGGDLLKIEHTANVYFERWNNNFNNMSSLKQYEFLLEHCTISEILEISRNKEIGIQEKVQILKAKYLKRH